MTNFENLDRVGQIIQLMQAGDFGRQAYKAGHTRRDNSYPAHTALSYHQNVFTQHNSVLY